MRIHLAAAALAAGALVGGFAVPAQARPSNYILIFRQDAVIRDGESLDYGHVVGTGHAGDIFDADIANGSSDGLSWAHGRDANNGVAGWVPTSYLKLYG